MKIYSMTATFGKLDGQTLTLKPGLNVIHAPNEWGKSTWCAFLVAMLYGIETRERTTAKALADKERYAPWSGKPMSGRMDISWNGRDITLERSTKGRTVFGNFRAYETRTGLPVSELTAENCGLTLLGVEKNVFTRAGFLKLTDMPVIDDLALRRRLNALVTTGDESGTSDRLAQKLKELKNRCRHNKTGLLPQAEARRDELQAKLALLKAAQGQHLHIRNRQEALEAEIRQLDNHQAALAFETAQADAKRVTAAKTALDTAALKVKNLETQCSALPARENAQQTLQRLEQLQLQWAQMQSKPLPGIPEAAAVFAGLDTKQALQQAKSDKAAYDMLCRPVSAILPILAAMCILAGIGLLFVTWLMAIPFPLLAAAFVLMHRRSKAYQKRDLAAVCARYGTLEPESWIPAAQSYAEAQQKAAAYGAHKDSLAEATKAVIGGLSLEDAIAEQKRVLTQWQTLEAARQDLSQAQQHAEALAAMVKDAPPPAFPDTLTYTKEQTQTRLADAAWEQQQLQLKLGQCMGHMESLGSEDALLQQLDAVNTRISKLEDTYAALTIAQQTLTEAANELQRRFAPRISQEAKALFEKLTQGRYDRLILGEDLSVSIGAQGEDTLRAVQWRSDGTVDQLYLALRLAVAQELTPHAPLILDDALVRFDETRLAQAMKILKEEAQRKQVILFTCQTREEKML